MPLTAAVTYAQSSSADTESHASENLPSVIQKTITQNPEVKSAFQAFTAAGYDTDEARGNYLPSIDATAGIGRENLEDDGRGSFDTDFAQIELNQMVFDGFATANEVERLNSARLVRYYELLNASEQVSLEAARAYADVQRYRELVRLARANYAEHQDIHNKMEERTASGAGRGVDLEQIAGRLALAESNLLTEASNLHDVSARYKRIVGTLPAQNLAAFPGLERQLPESVSEAVNMAFEGNPEFHAAIQNIQSVRAQREGTLSGFQPRVDLVGRAGTNNSSDTGLSGRRDEQSIEVVASVNLFRGGSDLASFRAASERVGEAVEGRELICRNVRQTTQIAYNDARRLREQMDYIEQHRESIERVRGAYAQQFDIGMRTLLDVLDSENEYFEASRAYVNAKYDVVIADARTLASMGQLLQTLEVANTDIPSLAELNSQGVKIDPESVCPTDSPASLSLSDLTGERGTPTRGPDITLSADTLFEVNNAKLSSAASKELMRLVEDIRERSDLARIYIAGHADITGNDAINEPLSRRRAESVANFLASEGVSRSLIQTEGFGSRKPVATNETDEGRRLNRRVEITLETGQELEALRSVQVTEASPGNPDMNASSSSAASVYLQVAALSKRASATELQKRLEDSLDGHVRILENGDLFRVQAGTDSSIAELKRQLDSMGYTETFPVTR